MADKILIVDDEQDILDLLVATLKRAGYTCTTAENGAVALKRITADPPSLILLDVMLPDMSGNEICRRLKSDPASARIPVIFLTAKGEEVDKIVGFELGADDYVTKPFSPRELVLRIKTILRRQSEPAQADPTLSLGELVLDRSRHVVTFQGKTIDLTPTEFKLLAVLIERRGRVQSRDRLLTDVWEYEAAIDTRTVDTHVRRLREKLGGAADLIETVRGVGYRALDMP
jgi:two-component system phosphate regulon response regulator PhoB